MAAPMNERDWIQLNAYLDGEMSAAEREAFERRLAQDPALQQELETLRATVALLHMAERVPVPRNFTLDPAVYGRQVRPNWLARLQAARPMALAAAVAAVAIIMGGVLLWNSAMQFASPTMVAMEAAQEQTEEPAVGIMAGPAEEAAPPLEAGATVPEEGAPADRSGLGTPALEEESVKTPVEEGTAAFQMAPPSAGGAIQPPLPTGEAFAEEATPEVEAAVPAQEGTPQVAPTPRPTPEAAFGPKVLGLALIGLGGVILVLMGAPILIRFIRTRSPQ